MRVTKSIAKSGNISSIVPFVFHVDHTEHDVDVIVTEQGYADLRGLAQRERVELIIENFAHPMYRDQLRAYYQEAQARGGQTPHVLEKAFTWHTNYAKNGTMLEPVVETVSVSGIRTNINKKSLIIAPLRDFFYSLLRMMNASFIASLYVYFTF